VSGDASPSEAAALRDPGQRIGTIARRVAVAGNSDIAVTMRHML